MIAPPRTRLARPLTAYSVGEARVDRRIGEIDQEIDEDHAAGEQHHEILHHDEIALRDRLEDQPPEAGQGEHVLDDDRAGEQEGELQADDGDHGDERVRHRMPPQRGAASEPLGARRADEILAQRLQHRGAGDAREDRRLRQGEREGGQDQRAEARPGAAIPAGEAARRKPREMHGEQQDQQDAEPEIRHRDADLRHAHRGDIARLAAARGGEHAGRNRDRGREHDRQQSERQAHQHALSEQLAHRHAVGVARAEIAAQQAEHPGEIAVPDRQIEAELVAQRGQRVGLRARAEDDLRGIAGQHLQHQEHDERRRQPASGRA